MGVGSGYMYSNTYPAKDLPEVPPKTAALKTASQASRHKPKAKGAPLSSQVGEIKSMSEVFDVATKAGLNTVTSLDQLDDSEFVLGKLVGLLGIQLRCGCTLV